MSIFEPRDPPPREPSVHVSEIDMGIFKRQPAGHLHRSVTRPAAFPGSETSLSAPAGAAGCGSLITTDDPRRTVGTSSSHFQTMAGNPEVSVWFLAVFGLMWAVGPLTQALQLVAPRLHHRLGMTEADAFRPEFKWYLLEERAIALADLTCLVAGVAFLWLALLESRPALIFGLYTCACYVYIAAISIPRWLLLRKHGLSPLHGGQLAVYASYMALYFLFGLFGLVYLWGLA